LLCCLKLLITNYAAFGNFEPGVYSWKNVNVFSRFKDYSNNSCLPKPTARSRLTAGFFFMDSAWLCILLKKIMKKIVMVMAAGIITAQVIAQSHKKTAPPPPPPVPPIEMTEIPPVPPVPPAPGAVPVEITDVAPAPPLPPPPPEAPVPPVKPPKAPKKNKAQPNPVVTGVVIQDQT